MKNILYNYVTGVIMKVVYVVDCITEINTKINMLKNRFGDDIFYVVKADLVDLFKTYGHTANAIYYNNLTKVIHGLLLKGELDDVVICYASLKFDDKLLNKFISTIGSRDKVVNLMPKYNIFEQMCNATYNIYVKSLFRMKDSLVSPKLQFIPQGLMIELLSTHLGNRLFEIEPEFCRNIYIDEQELNKSAKTTTKPIKLNLLSIIITLILTIGLLASIALFKVKYIVILVFIILYVLNFTLTIIFLSKAKFDKRFLK
jgi:hypothetical protein